jgi:hypothetical protein
MPADKPPSEASPGFTARQEPHRRVLFAVKVKVIGLEKRKGS